jgi:hypothetical protein
VHLCRVASLSGDRTPSPLCDAERAITKRNAPIRSFGDARKRRRSRTPWPAQMPQGGFRNSHRRGFSWAHSTPSLNATSSSRSRRARRARLRRPALCPFHHSAVHRGPSLSARAIGVSTIPSTRLCSGTADPHFACFVSRWPQLQRGPITPKIHFVTTKWSRRQPPMAGREMPGLTAPIRDGAISNSVRESTRAHRECHRTSPRSVRCLLLTGDFPPPRWDEFYDAGEWRNRAMLPAGANGALGMCPQSSMSIGAWCGVLHFGKCGAARRRVGLRLGRSTSA